MEVKETDMFLNGQNEAFGRETESFPHSLQNNSPNETFVEISVETENRSVSKIRSAMEFWKWQKSTWIRFLVILAYLALAGAFGFLIIQRKILIDFLGHVHRLGLFGNLVLCFLFLLISFPGMLGYTFLMLASGYLYGVFGSFFIETFFPTKKID